MLNMRELGTSRFTSVRVVSQRELTSTTSGDSAEDSLRISVVFLKRPRLMAHQMGTMMGVFSPGSVYLPEFVASRC